jgi:hypothetical protein
MHIVRAAWREEVCVYTQLVLELLNFLHHGENIVLNRKDKEHTFRPAARIVRT